MASFATHRAPRAHHSSLNEAKNLTASAELGPKSGCGRSCLDASAGGADPRSRVAERWAGGHDDPPPHIADPAAGRIDTDPAPDDALAAAGDDTRHAPPNLHAAAHFHPARIYVADLDRAVCRHVRNAHRDTASDVYGPADDRGDRGQ